MSEYQYYEFQAVDRRLTTADRAALRAQSSRAQITSTSFVNTYDWGDFKGDPLALMKRWFDLHLYLTNWGTRRLMMRLPRRLVDLHLLRTFLREVDDATLHVEADMIILDVTREQEEAYDDDDGSGWLSMLAPLRADVLAGDLRLFYLIWLSAVEADLVAADEAEPLPGLAPLSDALRAFAAFFQLDADLVEAASEAGASAPRSDDDAVKIAALPERDKTDLLVRLHGGDPHVAAELRNTIRAARGAPKTSWTPRTVGALRARAQAICRARDVMSAEKAEAERQRQVAATEAARHARLAAVRRRGDNVWREIDAEIDLSNAGGYTRATNLLVDLEYLADQDGTTDAFLDRLSSIRARHAKKRKLIERLAGALGV